MKPLLLSSIILLACSAILSGQSDFLSRKVKVENRVGTVGSLLDEIGREGGFYFSYNQDINRDRAVSLRHKQQSVQKFLDEIFKGEIYCVDYGNKVLIKRKPQLPEFYTVTGKVIDSVSREPILGVEVFIPGSDPLIGAVSDESGNFRINVTRDVDAIRFSCIGYESRSLKPGQQMQGSIGLVPRSVEIEEVVLETYRLPVKMESSLAISYLGGDRLERIGGVALEDALQGGVSGIHVVRNSGMPGASFQVGIRGIHSLINSNPVYYLNGVPIQQFLLNAVSCHDLESVEVLKDASSTSSYGASAGNGVILLHSKGGYDKGMKVRLNYQFGTQRNSNDLNLMHTDEFLDFSNEVRPEEYDWLDSAYRTNDNDHMKLMFHPAGMQDLHVSVSGGNERSQYYFGTGYFSQAATIKELQFRRLSFHVNSSHQIGKRWELGHHLSFSQMQHKGLKEGCFLNDHNNPILQSFITPPFIPDSVSVEEVMPGGADLISYVDAELTDNLRKNNAIFGNLFSRLELSRNISLETLFGYELLQQNNLSYNRKKLLPIPMHKISVLANEYRVLDLAYHFHNRLSFSETLGKNHQVEASLGFELGENENEWIKVQQSVFAAGSGNGGASVIVLPSASRAGYDVDYMQGAALGTLSYVYNDRYILNASLRREQVRFDSTEYNTKEYAAWYPSVSLGWIFMKGKRGNTREILSFGKIRYAFGVAGNSPRLNYSFHAEQLRKMSYAYSFGSSGNITNSSKQRQTNQKFYWEQVRAHNLGLELGLFRNKLFISTDLFRNYLDEGSTSPYTNPLENFGELYGKDYYGLPPLPVAEMVNTGFESEINYRKSGSFLHWDLSLHLTRFRNRIVNLDSSEFASYNRGSVDPLSVNLPGEAAGSFYGYRIERLFGEDDCPAPGETVTNQPYIDNSGKKIYAQPNARAGDNKFMDINNDGIIDKNDKTIIGNPQPDFIFGFYASVRFRKFDLSTFWQGSYGNDIYNATKLWLFNPYASTNWSREILDSYQSPKYNDAGEEIPGQEGNTDTELHRFDYLAENKNLRVSDFYVEDGSYIRLKNIQLGYTFDPVLTRKIHIENLRIYVCAWNLLTFTRYKGLDPEVGGWGIDCGIYPQPRTFIAGINLEFR